MRKKKQIIITETNEKPLIYEINDIPNVEGIEYGEEYNVDDYVFSVDIGSGENSVESSISESNETKETYINKGYKINYPGTEPNNEIVQDKAVYNIYREKSINQKDLNTKVLRNSNKYQYKANKKVGIVSCPKCGSTSITTSNKKISVGKGVVGAAVGSLVNPVGTVVGAAVGVTHSKKIYNVCMNCGYKWKP